MNSFCWPRLLTFCRVFCCSACLCCLCMCSSVWHVKVTDELRFCVIYQPFLEVQSQWCATKRDIKCKKSAESIFVLFLCTCLLTYLRFVFSQPARGSRFALGLTFFPWSTSMAPTAHTFSHSQQKHIFFVLPKCLQNLYQTESSPPCAINPE